METVSLFLDYIVWHYTRGLLDLLGICGNFIYFTWHYFSIKQLAITFFTPWRRLGDITSRRWDLFEVFSSFVVTACMRVVGILLRGVTIVLGLISLVAVFVLEIVTLVAWIIMPAIVAFIFALGISLLLK